MSGQPLEVVEVEQPGCFELIGLHSGATQPLAAALSASTSSPGANSPWPTKPGAVLRTADGRLEALHFAPGRWLLPDPSAELFAAIAGQSAAVLVDVEGKWQRRSVRGSGAMRLLAAAADVEAMLAGRDCAALSLCDCPAIVARGRGTIELWVHASFARFLDEGLAHIRSRVASRRAP